MTERTDLSETKIADYKFQPWLKKNGARVKTSDATWKKPLKWNRAAESRKALHDRHPELEPYERPRVLCVPDVFEDWQGPIVDKNADELSICSGCRKIVYYTENCGGETDMCLRCPRPLTMDDLRRDLFALIAATPNLDWLPEDLRVREMPGVET